MKSGTFHRSTGRWKLSVWATADMRLRCCFLILRISSQHLCFPVSRFAWMTSFRLHSLYNRNRGSVSGCRLPFSATDRNFFAREARQLPAKTRSFSFVDRGSSLPRTPQTPIQGPRHKFWSNQGRPLAPASQAGPRECWRGRFGWPESERNGRSNLG